MADSSDAISARCGGPVESTLAGVVDRPSNTWPVRRADEATTTESILQVDLDLVGRGKCHKQAIGLGADIGRQVAHDAVRLLYSWFT